MLLVTGLAASRAAPAQSLELAPYGGWVWVSRLADVNGTLLISVPSLGVQIERRIVAHLRAESAPHAGISLGLPLRQHLDVRVNLARAATSFEINAHSTQVDGSDAQAHHFDELGNISIWQGSVDVVWRPLGGTRAVLLVTAGVGAAHWKLRGLEDLGQLSPIAGTTFGVRPVEAALVAGSIGVGVAARIHSRLGVRAELLDHIEGDPLDDQDFVLGSTFTGSALPRTLVHSLRASLGGTLRIGG